MKVGQNIKYDILVLQNYGMEVKGELFDTMIAHYVLQPELRHNMIIWQKFICIIKPSTLMNLSAREERIKRTCGTFHQKKFTNMHAKMQTYFKAKECT